MIVKWRDFHFDFRFLQKGSCFYYSLQNRVVGRQLNFNRRITYTISKIFETIAQNIAILKTTILFFLMYDVRYSFKLHFGCFYLEKQNNHSFNFYKLNLSVHIKFYQFDILSEKILAFIRRNCLLELAIQFVCMWWKGARKRKRACQSKRKMYLHLFPAPPSAI